MRTPRHSRTSWEVVAWAVVWTVSGEPETIALYRTREQARNHFDGAERRWRYHKIIRLAGEITTRTP